MEGGVEVSCQQRRGARSLRASIHVKFAIRCPLTEATTAFMPMHKVENIIDLLIGVTQTKFLK